MREENIIIYTIDNLYDGLKIYINKIKDNIEKGDEILKKICNDINIYIRRLFNSSNIPSEERQIELMARGGNSVCYRSVSHKNVHQFIYKVFYPLEFSCSIPYGKIKNVKEQFCLIPDCAEPDCRKKFLRKFVRFIGQKDEIDLCGNEAGDNLFQSYVLKFSSKGFVYEVNLQTSSETLEDKFRRFIPPEDKKPSLEDFKEIIKLVNMSAKNICKFCHHLGECKSCHSCGEDAVKVNIENISSNKIFHGDIKPENFLVIYTSMHDNEYFIRNIDFDTWVSSEKIKDGYLKNFAASTNGFYDIDPQHIKENQSPEGWFCYDVQALGRIFMYACSLLVGFDDVLSKVKSKKRSMWVNYFFTYGDKKINKDNCPANEIFELLGADKNLSDLLIFERIKELLLWCEALDKNEKDVKEFIIRLSNIEQLLEGKKANDDNLFMRYLNLKYLDSEIKRKSPFATQCFEDLLIKDKKEEGILKLDYKNFIETERRKDGTVHLLFTDFVEQVLNKAFEEETGDN